MFSAGVGVVFLKLLESESGVGVGFLKLLELESGVGVGFSKLLESESGVGFLKNLPTPQPWVHPCSRNHGMYWSSEVRSPTTIEKKEKRPGMCERVMVKSQRLFMTVTVHFAIPIYDRTSSLNDIDEALFELFTKRGQTMENFQLTKAALVQHIKRAVYEWGHYWGHATVPAPEIRYPENWDWTSKEVALKCSALCQSGGGGMWFIVREYIWSITCVITVAYCVFFYVIGL